MFPIPWNFPLRKKNGNLVNIGDAIDEGTELPEHGEGDAGKVLSVDENGDLEWSDDVNSEIQTLTNKLNGEVETRAKLGAHNLLCSNIPTTNKNNASVVLNSDGSYTVSTSSATSGSVYLESTQSFTLDVGTYTFTDTPNGETAQTTDAVGIYVTGINGSSDWFRTNYNRELVVTQKSTVKFGLYVAINQTVSTPITFKPMIRLASDSNMTYQPYAMTNRELTDRVVKSSKIDLPSTSIAVGSTETITIPAASLPSDFHNALAIIPISVGPEGWSTTLPGVITNVNLTNLTVSVRAYTAQNFAPTVILLYV